MDKSNISEFTQGDLVIEQGLGWPAGTLRCLREAFVAGRRREDPWDLAQGPEGRQQAMAQAAAVFRRGVVVNNAAPSGYRRAQISLAGSVAATLADLTDPKAGALGSEASGAVRFLFVVDEAIARLWPEFSGLDSQFPVWVLRGGEAVKNLETASSLTVWIRTRLGSQTAGGKAIRGTRVVAVGGGVTLDVAGFAAGLCGLEHVNIPTTLLAMVDAAIGGKTGVNFPPFGKNQVGLFHFPARVVICPEFLKTLPPEEMRAGAAECLKHALLANDMNLFETWVQLARDGNTAVMEDCGPVLAVARMKEAFVDRDPFERSGAREMLNLGHTTAHALESLAQSRGQVVRHGAAVALGLACKAELMAATQPESASAARKIMAGLKASHCLDEIENWFSGLGTPFDALWPSMIEQMRQDKKLRVSDSSGIRIVGLRWNSAINGLETHAMEVEPETLRRAFVRSLNPEAIDPVY